ncbi:MAG: XdhC family protein [Pseudomonadota bacterium]
MNIILQINDLIAKAEVFCLATVITSSGGHIAPGVKTIIYKDGTMEGGTGEQETDGLILDIALKAYTQQEKKLLEIKDGLVVFFDFISTRAKLIICGAGHIAIPLAQFAQEVGFAVTVIDDRPDFANQARFPGCEVIADDFITSLRSILINSSSFVVIITRGHEHDAECLAEIVLQQTAYIGLIGSRRRVGFVLEMLVKNGIPKERLADVCTPIGIPIGAESPEEIALSITAELVCVRRKGVGQAKDLSDAVRGIK